MNRARSTFCFLLASLVPVPLSAQAPAQTNAPAAAHFAFGEKLRVPGIPNFGKINDHLYRGAQPRGPGLLELKKLGVTTIVDLRTEDPAKISWEEKRSESLGIHFVKIPVGGWSPPADQQVAEFLSIFRDRPREKVFVHCHYGEDRTGVFIASYRIAFEKMPPNQALQEMYYFGFNGFWHPSMADFVQSLPRRLDTDPPLLPFKNAP